MEGEGRHGYEELYEDSFFDWETSDGNLKELESRIAAFCSPTPGQRGAASPRPPSSRGRPLITSMKRFEVEVRRGQLDYNPPPPPLPLVVCHGRWLEAEGMALRKIGEFRIGA